MLAYELLLQDTPPSWLTMVDRGATTVWELWEGVDAGGVAHASLNHYSKGTVASFLHRYVAGLRPSEPGYRVFEVRPRPRRIRDQRRSARPSSQLTGSWWIVAPGLTGARETGHSARDWRDGSLDREFACETDRPTAVRPRATPAPPRSECPRPGIRR